MIEYVAEELRNKVYQLQKLLDQAELTIKELKKENSKLVDQPHSLTEENETTASCC